MDRYISKAVASAVHVCIDEYHLNSWEGRIYTLLNKEEIRFCSTDELVNILGRFWDLIGFPQESTINRSFAGPKQIQDKKLKNVFFQVVYPEDGTRDKIKVEMTEDDMKGKRGDRGTFLVRIQYRQNATWQGHVTWVDENKTVPFRSALELIKLMDEALEENVDIEEGGSHED